MKNKTLFLFILFTTFHGKLWSQHFDGGITFGFSVSQVDGDTYAGYHQPGLTGGVYTTRKLTRDLDGTIELRYTAKGARKTGGKDDPMLYHQKLRYIEMPVKAAYLFEKYSASLELGIVSGYLFNHSGEFNGSELVYGDPLKKFELSWVAGFKYHVNNQFAFSLQYNYSLLPIIKYENSDFNYGPLARLLYLTNGDYNNVILFGFCYKIGR